MESLYEYIEEIWYKDIAEAYSDSLEKEEERDELF